MPPVIGSLLALLVVIVALALTLGFLPLGKGKSFLLGWLTGRGAAKARWPNHFANILVLFTLARSLIRVIERDPSSISPFTVALLLVVAGAVAVLVLYKIPILGEFLREAFALSALILFLYAENLYSPDTAGEWALLAIVIGIVYFVMGFLFG